MSHTHLVSIAKPLVPIPSQRPKFAIQKRFATILFICSEALKKYGEQPICSTHMLSLVQHILSSVQCLKIDDETLCVEEQKQWTLDAVHWLIDIQQITDKEKNALDALAESAFPQAVELILVSEVKETTCLCFF